MDVGPIDIYNAWVDVSVRLTDDEFQYVFDVATPKALASYMDKKKQRFVGPCLPPIIVQELTSVAVREAIEAYLNEDEENFWLKLYSAMTHATIDELNSILDRDKKESAMQEEDDEDDSFHISCENIKLFRIPIKNV